VRDFAAASLGALTALLITSGGHALLGLLFPVIVVALLAARGGYRNRLRARALERASEILTATSLAAVLILALFALLFPAERYAEVLVLTWALTFSVLAASAGVAAVAQRRVRASGGRPTLIIGAGAVGNRIANRLSEHTEYGLSPVGFIDAAPDGLRMARSVLPVLGPPGDLEDIARGHQVKHVVVAFSAGSDAQNLALIERCRALDVEVSVVPRLFEGMGRQQPVEHIGGLPLIRAGSLNPDGWRFALKQGLDRVVAFLLLFALLPLLLILAVGVKLSSPGPVLFRQRRVGRDGEVFEILKFRTMRPSGQVDDSFMPSEGFAPGGVEGVDRRTRFGTWLRRTSLDEIPQLINVLRGEMAIVGPRPERPEYVALFSQRVPRYGDRHRVPGGITGWAQVHGFRGQTSLENRVEWDNFYIENWSLRLDLTILLLTLPTVFDRRAQ
jgi:exopolysaccharide biosynthesis polyprenyl glycosylphosphotransferase